MCLFQQCNTISIEEFHNNLQDVTNFPLRPFVLPFLKTHIPILQKEITMQAKLTKQVPTYFIDLYVTIRLVL